MIYTLHQFDSLRENGLDSGGWLVTDPSLRLEGRTTDKAVQCIELHCSAVQCSAVQCTALHCTALHCTALHCTELHCNALQCTALL